MDAEQAHRHLVSLCAQQINSAPYCVQMEERVRLALVADAQERAERVIRIVRRWDRGERF